MVLINTNTLLIDVTPTTSAIVDSDNSTKVLRNSRTPTTTDSYVSTKVLKNNRVPTTKPAAIDSDIFTNSIEKDRNNDQQQTMRKSVKFNDINITSRPNQIQDREIIIDGNSDESGSSLSGKY